MIALNNRALPYSIDKRLSALLQVVQQPLQIGASGGEQDMRLLMNDCAQRVKKKDNRIFIPIILQQTKTYIHI
jgi:hypothetical protein